MPRDVLITAVCVCSLVAGCADHEAPDSSAGELATATASLWGCEGISMEITSPAMGANLAYSPGGASITVDIDVDGVQIGLGLGEYMVQYRMDGVVEAPGVPSTGSFTFNQVEAGGHVLCAQLIDGSTGEPLLCEEALACVYVVVVQACVFGAGDGPCDDGNACTIDHCEPDGVCSHKTSEDPACCDSADECPITWQCVNNLCFECIFDGQCPPPQDPCTASVSCEAGTCTPVPIPGCCLSDADCAGDPCTGDTCDLQSNICEASPSPPLPDGDVCCDTDADCVDGWACTDDVCEAGWCHHVPVPGCCYSAAGCDDGLACTQHLCVLNECISTQDEACCTPGDAPLALVEACGPDPDGPLSCFAWSCTAQGDCLLLSNPTCCSSHDDCDDGNACTLDACTADLKCKNLLQADEGCCASNGDCSQDGDPCTAAVCDAGTCMQHVISGCVTPP